MNAQIGSISDIAVDTTGTNVYILDFGNRVIRRISGGIITTFAGTGSWGYTGDNGPAVNAQLSPARGIFVDGIGNVFIGDTHNYAIRKVTSGIITTIAGGNGPGYSGDGGPALDVNFRPASSASILRGHFFFYDHFAYRIRKIAAGVVDTIAGNGRVQYSGDGQSAASAQLSADGIAVDSSGNLKLAALDDNLILSVTSGIISVFAGNGTYGPGGDGGPAVQAQLAAAKGVALYQADTYIADWANHEIRKVSGGIITRFAGTGTAGSGGDSGPATAAQLLGPRRLAVAANGDVYIADNLNNRIRKVSGGIISTRSREPAYKDIPEITERLPTRSWTALWECLARFRRQPLLRRYRKSCHSKSQHHRHHHHRGGDRATRLFAGHNSRHHRRAGRSDIGGSSTQRRLLYRGMRQRAHPQSYRRRHHQRGRQRRLWFLRRRGNCHVGVIPLPDRCRFGCFRQGIRGRLIESADSPADSGVDDHNFAQSDLHSGRHTRHYTAWSTERTTSTATPFSGMDLRSPPRC